MGICFKHIFVIREEKNIKNFKNFNEQESVILGFMRDPMYKPMRARDMMLLLQIPKERNEELHHVLDHLLSRGLITMDKKGRYRLVGEESATGIFHSTTRGFGFVTVSGMEKDVYISEMDKSDAFHEDEVEINITRAATDSRSAEGKIVKIIKRGITEVTGVFERSKNFAFVIPDNQKFGTDIYIGKNNCKDVVTGHRVLVKIVSYGSKFKNPEGVVLEDLGDALDERNDLQLMLKAFGIPDEFPEEEMAEIAKIPDHVLPHELEDRMDLRGLQTVTIDGADAKDLDDAITLRVEDGIYHLGVHIADVSHYVKEGSAIDREALNRGTSVYLIDTVVPMLPKELSNGICSLNQGVDRLALSCLMDFDSRGNLLSHQVAETVINVDKRMTYDKVFALLEEETCTEEEYLDFIPFFKNMETLSAILREKRLKRGALEFDFPESKIHLDEMGHVASIECRLRNTATDLIEDFMLAANETIAENHFWQELPFVYRIHPEPNIEKLEQLVHMIGHMEYGMKGLSTGKNFHAKELQKLLDRCKGKPEEMFINRCALRSMQQARYSTECAGHFGLAATYYCHFTSPIRRYPDLQIHRIIKEVLHEGLTEERRAHYVSILSDVAKQSSDTERRAEEAERELTKMKMCAYMEDHIGEDFTGIITSVMNWGIYVELPNTIEGMISVDDMHDDYYEYDKYRMRLEGLFEHRRYEIGMEVNVKLQRVDRQAKTIYFILADLAEDDW